MRKKFGELVCKLGKKDKKIVVLVGDISHGLFQNLRELDENRYYNIGINEQSMINIASGLSMQGFNPVVHTIAPFLIDRNFEQLKLDFSYSGQNINLVSVGGSFDYSKLGCTHHSYSDVSLIMHLDNSKVFVPGSPEEFEKLFLKNYNSKGIKYFKLFNKSHNYKKINNGSIFLDGESVTIVCTGTQLENVLKARENLIKKKIYAEIVYFNTLKPFNSKNLIKSLRKTKRLLVVEELSSQDGILNLCLKKLNYIENLKYSNISINKFIKGYGSYEWIAKKNGFSPTNIFNKCVRLVSEK